MSEQDHTPEQRAFNFVAMLSQRPGMVLGDNRHLLHRIQAFIAGLKWANAFTESGDHALNDFLCGLESKLSKVLLDSDSGVGWLDELMNRAGGDESLAFEHLISALRDLATKAHVINIQ